MAIDPAETTLFKTIVNQSASNGLDPIEFSSIQAELRNLQVKPEARAEALQWAAEFHPEMRATLDALAASAGFDFDAMQRQPASVTLDTARMSDDARAFAPALLAIHGPAINLTTRNANALGTTEVRAVCNAVGDDRLDTFFATVLAPSSGMMLKLSNEGAVELGRQAQLARVSSDKVDAFRATLSTPLLESFNAGIASARGRRISHTH